MTALSLYIFGGIIALMDLLLEIILHDMVPPLVIKMKTPQSNHRRISEKLKTICMKPHYVPFDEYREVRERFRRRFELPERPSMDETVFWKRFQSMCNARKSQFSNMVH